MVFFFHDYESHFPWLFFDYESQWLHVRGVKSTWKSYLSKSTDTLQWKLLHCKLQVTNTKTTWVKVLEYLILTVRTCFSYTKYKLKDALLKETSQSKTVTLWRSWGKQAEARIYVQAFHGKTRTNNKPKTAGKQTTITFNKSQRTKATLGMYILYIYRRLTSWTR